MNYTINHFVADKAILVNDQFNVDEERQLIAFEIQDLQDVINCVIRSCADFCSNEVDRQAILDLTK